MPQTCHVVLNISMKMAAAMSTERRAMLNFRPNQSAGLLSVGSSRLCQESPNSLSTQEEGADVASAVDSAPGSDSLSIESYAGRSGDGAELSYILSIQRTWKPTTAIQYLASMQKMKA